MARLIDFTPEILAEVPDSDAVLFAPLRKSLREFCQVTDCWQEEGISGVTTGVTQANPAVFSSARHNLRDGELILLSDFVGMTELNGMSATVNRIDSDSYTVNEVTNGVASGVALDSTSFGAYVSGGAFVTNGINVTSGKSRYNVFTSIETVPYRILRVLYDTRPLTPISLKDLDRNSLFYAETPFQVPVSGQWELQNGTPIAYLVEGNKVIRTYPIPNQSKLGSLKVTVALQPSERGTYVADHILESYRDEIVLGATAILKGQKNQPWFDREGSLIDRELYEKKMYRVKNRIIRGNNNTQIYLSRGGYAC